MTYGEDLIHGYYDNEASPMSLAYLPDRLSLLIQCVPSVEAPEAPHILHLALHCKVQFVINQNDPLPCKEEQQHISHKTLVNVNKGVSDKWWVSFKAHQLHTRLFGSDQGPQGNT